MQTSRYERLASPLTRVLLWLAAAVTGLASSVHAEDYYFDPALLQGAAYGQDLARFNQHDAQIEAGEHVLDVFVNDQLIAASEPVTFVSTDESGVKACLSPALLEKTAIRVIRSTARQREACLLLSDTGQSVAEEVDVTALRLNLVVAQQALLRTPRGYIPVSEWDRGIPALSLRHNTNYYRTENRDNNYRYGYLWSALNAGSNIGLWQLRHQGNLRYYDSSVSGSEYKYNAVRTWVDRPIPAIESMLTLGDSYTSNSLFGSLSFNGVKLASDQRMWPQGRRGFAPEVRGVAGASARVVVRQLGQIIYETSVPPGAFVIRDLYNTQDRGDLQVEVIEANGRVSTFTVPYASVPDSVRPGNWQYEVALGRVRHFNSIDNQFIEGVVQHGLNNMFTLNGGIRVADDYVAGLFGTVIATPLGAIGTNATWSHADVNGQTETGWRSELSYGRTFTSGTSVVLAAWHYSTTGFRDLQDVLGQRRQYRNDGNYWSDSLNQKNRFSATVSQAMGTWGMLNMSASTSSYYGESSRVTQLQLGYSNTWRNISYNLSVARQRTVWERGRNFVSVNDADYDNTGQQRYTETLVALGFSVPFDVGNTRSTVSLDMNRTGASRSGTLSVAGASGDNSQLTWSAYTGVEDYQHGGSAMTVGGSAQQSTSVGSVRASVAQGDNYRQFGVGAASTLVLHQGGITLGPYASDTFALIRAPGAEGARVRNGQGATIDRFGYAILPSLAPYRYNTITLDASTMNDETELQGGSQRVVPYAGALAQVSFSTLQGRAVLIATHLEDGNFPPMGADVTDAAGNSVGMVGQGGQIYARLAEERGTLQVIWGPQAGEQCAVSYRLPPRGSDAFTHLELPCQPRRSP